MGYGIPAGWVQLGFGEVFEIPLYDSEETSWVICKYSQSEPRVALSDLSLSARYAVAHEFGIPIHTAIDPSIQKTNPFDLNYVNGALLFYFSPAFNSLIDMAKKHPLKAKKWGENHRLGKWGAAAIYAAEN